MHFMPHKVDYSSEGPGPVGVCGLRCCTPFAGCATRPDGRTQIANHQPVEAYHRAREPHIHMHNTQAARSSPGQKVQDEVSIQLRRSETLSESESSRPSRRSPPAFREMGAAVPPYF